jgi:ABC-type lipopolysaccharide export system ATPase subunit
MIPISFKNLQKSFKYGFNKRQNVLKSISLDIKEGEVFGFLGPNPLQSFLNSAGWLQELIVWKSERG